MKNNVLDKFYTNPMVSDELVELFLEIFKGYEITSFLEPSAGSGNFIDSLIKNKIPKDQIEAYDISPCLNSKIKKADFLKLAIEYKKGRITIGNPPFGKYGNLAIEFLNKCLEISDIVAFILPLTFKRYSVQKRIEKTARLIYEIPLSNNGFLVNNRVYKVNCVFQIWVNSNVKVFSPDIRQKYPPINKIPEITTFIHNNTKNTIKYFNKEKYKWDFAVPRQGFYDYNEKIFNPKKLVKNRQYLFIKINDSKIAPYVEKVDFEKLSNLNTTVKGFSNTDFIEELYSLKRAEVL